MARLMTTRGRIMVAATFGLIGPPLLCSGAMTLLQTSHDGERIPFWLGFAAVLAANVGLMILPGIPLWIIFHRRGAGVRAALIAGGMTGLFVCGGITGAAYALDGVAWPQVVQYAVFVGIVSGILGAATVGLMWKIAYPRRLQSAAEQIATF